MTRIPDIEKLREVALDQHGLITASQAEDVGVSRPSLSFLVRNNRIERVDRGIYRIPQVPYSPYDRHQQVLLWAGENAVLSHDTALAAWSVCDINPTIIHVTIPKARRIKKKIPKGVILHKGDIEESQIKWWEGMQTTSLPLSVRQCIERGVSSHLIEQAIQNGTSRGMIKKNDAEMLRAKMEARDALC